MRSIPVTRAVVVAAAFAGCGSAKDSGGADAPSAASAKASIEHAAGLSLTARRYPLKHATRASRPLHQLGDHVQGQADGHLFLLKDENVADKVKEMVKGTVPAGSAPDLHGKVLALDAAVGSDHGADVEKAVNVM